MFFKRLIEMFTSPLTQKVVIGIFAGIVVIEAIILVPSYDKRERDLLGHLESRVGQSFAAIMSVPKLTLDEKVAALRSLDGIIAVEEIPTGERTSRYNEGRQTYELVKALRVDPSRSLVITTDAVHVAEQLKHYVFRILGLIVIISAFMTLVSILILGKICIGPLMALKKELQDSKDGASLKVLPKELTGRYDELGEIARSFQSLGANVESAFKEIEVLARFPFENPNPILRCNAAFDVMYSNTIAFNEPAFFNDEDKQHLHEDLQASVTVALAQGLTVQQNFQAGDHVFAFTFVPIVQHDYCNLYGRDVTARIKAEESLQDMNDQLEHLVWERTVELKGREAQLKATISASLDAIIVLNEKGEIIEFNRNAEEIFEYTRAELLGESFYETLMLSNLSGGVEGRPNNLGNLVVGQRTEAQARRKSGEVFSLEVAIDVAKGVEDVQYVAYLRDITERKSQEKDLIQAKEQAEAANKAKSEFLATMSHEIRTPMNGVIGMTELLLETDLTDEQKRNAQTIHDSGEALLRIINDILDYTKIDVGKLALEETEFDLVALCESVVGLMSGKAQQKNLEFGSRISPDLAGYFVSDAGRIRQVLLNLLNNAIKFTPEGKVSLKVYKTIEGITFDVRDTGIGIAMADQHKLFHKFSQVDASTTRKYGGTGLGLAISRLIVQALGGSIEVKSKPGEGSTFSFTLPLFKVDRPIHLPAQGREKSVQAVELQDNGYHILVAEDNPVNQMVARGNLEKLGHRVAIANDGNEAVEAVKNNAYDLVFMDIQMPHCDGYEATRQIRALTGEQARTPIVAMTANAMSEDRQRCLDVGMNEFLPKPVKRQTIAEVIALLLGGSETKSPDVRPVSIGVDRVENNIFDEEVITGLIEDLDLDGYQMILRTFVKNSTDRFDKIATAIASQDLSQLRKEAHSLKGAARSVGACQIAQLAVQIEEEQFEDKIVADMHVTMDLLIEEAKARGFLS